MKGAFMMFRLAALAGAGILLAAGPALAQSTVVYGSSDARLCYQAAQNARIGARDVQTPCHAALAAAETSRRDRAATHVNLGILQALSGDYETAIASYEAAIEINPALPQTYLNRGLARMALGLPRAAIDDFTRVLELGEREALKALYNRARAYEQLEMYREAYDDLHRALEIRPGWEPALSELERFTVLSENNGA